MPASSLPPSGPALDRVIRRNAVTLGAAPAIGWTIIQPQAGLMTIRAEIMTGRIWPGGVASPLFSLMAAIGAVAPATVLARGRMRALAR